MKNEAIAKIIEITAATFIDSISRGIDAKIVIDTLRTGLESVLPADCAHIALCGALVCAENQLVAAGSKPSPTKIGAMAAGIRLAAMA